jgi:hypothetical protein
MLLIMNLGFYTEINDNGNGNRATEGQIVTVDVALKAYCCEVLRESGSPYKFYSRKW